MKVKNLAWNENQKKQYIFNIGKKLINIKNESKKSHLE